MMLITFWSGCEDICPILGAGIERWRFRQSVSLDSVMKEIVVPLHRHNIKGKDVMTHH